MDTRCRVASPLKQYDNMKYDNMKYSVVIKTHGEYDTFFIKKNAIFLL